MKICLSEFTYEAFKDLLSENFKNDEFILIDSEANIISGEGKPDAALVSYELMFKALKSEDFFEKYLSLIEGCSYVQGSWAGIETPQAQALIDRAEVFSHGGGLHAIPIATYIFAQILRSIKSIDAHIALQKEKNCVEQKQKSQFGSCRGVQNLSSPVQWLSRKTKRHVLPDKVFLAFPDQKESYHLTLPEQASFSLFLENVGSVLFEKGVLFCL